MQSILTKSRVRPIRLLATVLCSSVCLALFGCADSPSPPQTATSLPPQEAKDARSLEHFYDDLKPTHTGSTSTARPFAQASNTASTVAGTPQKSGLEKTNPLTNAVAQVDSMPSLSGKSPLIKADSLNSRTLTKPVITGAPRKVEVLVKDHVFTREEDGVLRVLYEDLDLLRVLNMEPVTADCDKKMPDWLKQLNGKRVRIRGFMAPTFLESNITNFVMARDTQACCFGPNTKIYHLIEVQMKSGLTADYQPFRPLEVEGTFRIEPVAEDDMMVHLYFISDAEIVKKK